MSEDFGKAFREMIGLKQPRSTSYRVLETFKCDGFHRERVEYLGDDERMIGAYLFSPDGSSKVGGVVVYHQHNGEFHLGKSEVAGLAGDPRQAFGPALAKNGAIVLAPDAVSFEDRRAAVRGTEPASGDWLQHYNAMGYRMVNGDLLARKVLDDGQRALTALLSHPRIDSGRTGIGGHSFGGTTALYHAAVDERVRFACVSGAGCSFAKRQESGTGIGMMELVPGLARRFEISDVMAATAPAELFVVSTADDEYSADADEMIEIAGSSKRVSQFRGVGGHALDSARYSAIVQWLTERASGKSPWCA